MKRSFFIFLSIALALGRLCGYAAGKTVTTAKIYLNPGHGSWGPNDRPMATIPYPFLASTGRPDTCGFYESNTNLWKVLRMRQALLDLGMKSSNIKLSRWANGPYPYVAGASNAYKYNRNLSEICEEVDAWGADMFFSVHSDAASDGSTANRSLYIYRGTDASNYVAGSKAMAQALWTRAYVGTNGIDYASSTSTNIRGDITFYGSSSTRTGSNGNKYTGYLGVLKHGIPGFLAEGYCHTYQPARHRALNSDYCGQEGVRYSRGVADYFGWTRDTKGYIMGFVKDKSKSVNHSLYTYKSGTRAGDEYWPVMGATVSLYQDGTLVDTYTTDNNYNGVFVFERLDPGNYTVIVRASGYNDHTENVTVTANETTYPRIYVTPGSGTDPEPQPTEKIKGIFAYNLNLTKGENSSYTFSFNANSDALSGRIIFTDSISGETIGSILLDEVKEGPNSFAITNDRLPENAGQEQVLNWSVELTGKPITAITRLNDTGSAFNYTRASVTVDNSPESNYFGSVYVNDLKTRNASSSNAGNRDNGIYRYNPLWQRENTTPYTGNMAWDNNFRITTDYRGTLYIPDFGDNHSGVYIAHPDHLGDTWQNLFAGSRTVSGDLAGLITNNGVNTGSSSPSAYVCGSGADSKLYVALEDMDNRVYCYDLGSQMDADGNLPTKWYTEPELVHTKTDLKYTNKNVIAQADGAVWIAENLYITSGSLENLATQPALRYITPRHDDYWSYATNSNTPVTNLNGCAGGGFVITPDNKQIIIVDGDGVLQFFNVNDSNRDKPLLTWQRSFTADARDSGCTTVGGGRVPNGVYQMAFDWGGNLYVAGGSLGIYSIPTTDNRHVTPAKKAMTLTKGEVIIPEPEPYVVKKDIDTYADNDNLSLTSDWVRSVKEEYDNIVFDESGIRNRGFAVSGDKVFVTARSENATDADLFLLTLDRYTGETLGRLDLSHDANVELYGCNDVLIDAAGNMVISNLTTDLATAPLQLFKVDTITGNVQRVAQLSTTISGIRLDHCNIVGDVTSGNFTVMAAQASGKRLLSWAVTDGQATDPVVVEAQTFYPATATHFGIAPRIYPTDATHAYVTGSTVHPTLYNLTDGSIIDSFGNNEEIKPNGLNANGLTTFSMGQRRFMVYPSEDYRNSEGNKFTLAVSESGDVKFTHLKKVFEFPTRGLGAVHSQTWGAPVSAEVSDDGHSAQIVVYVPGEGLASYTLGDLTEPVEEYVIKKDIDTYADTLGLSLASNWVRSVKSEYDNISFKGDGILNRGFAMSGDVVYVSARDANATDADISLLRFDRATGRTLTPLPLADAARVPYYACNDVLTDAAGNVLVANLTLNIATTALQLHVVDTITGGVTKVAELIKTNAEGARIDHCGVLGDVTSGNFTVMAAQAGGRQIISWTIEDGVVKKSNVVEVVALYPATAANFGIAPRIFPVSDSTAYVSGSNTHLTLYHVNTGQILDSFEQNAAITPVGIQANGFAAFTLGGKSFMLYPDEDYRGAEGNKFMLAMSDDNSLQFAHLSPVYEFPKRGLGAVHSQTWGALIATESHQADRSADIVVYVPGEGLASYSLALTKVTLRGDVNGDGVVSGADVTALYGYLLDGKSVAGEPDVSGDGLVSGADVTALYNILLNP